jgi:hypothetical protein
VFNALWLNATELNGSGLLLQIESCAATAAAGATPGAVSLYRIRGLAASVTGTASALCTEATVNPMLAVASAGAIGALLGAPISALRGFAVNVFCFSDSLLGNSTARHMASSVGAGASGLMLPYSKLLLATAAAGATAATPTLVEIHSLSGGATATATAANLTGAYKRNFRAVAAPGAIGIAQGPDVFNASKSIWSRTLGAQVSAGATAVLPRGVHQIFGTGATTSFSSASFAKQRAFGCLPQPAGVFNENATLAAISLLHPSAASAGAAVAVPRLYRIANFKGATAAAGTTLLSLPRMTARRTFAALASTAVTAVPPALKFFRGLFAHAYGSADVLPSTLKIAQKFFAEATAGAIVLVAPTLKIAQKLYGIGAPGSDADAVAFIKIAQKLFADAAAGATAVEAGDFTYITFYADVACNAGGDVHLARGQTLHAATAAGATPTDAQLWINLLAFEPDFRTYTLDADDWTDTIDADDWTLTITDDATSMKTFAKQPNEILAYDIDFLTWFLQVPADYIQSATCTVVSATVGLPSALTINSVLLLSDSNVTATLDSPGLLAHRVKIWTQGGTDGATYKLTLVANTHDGRRKEVDFKIKVKEI